MRIFKAQELEDYMFNRISAKILAFLQPKVPFHLLSVKTRSSKANPDYPSFNFWMKDSNWKKAFGFLEPEAYNLIISADVYNILKKGNETILSAAINISLGLEISQNHKDQWFYLDSSKHGLPRSITIEIDEKENIRILHSY